MSSLRAYVRKVLKGKSGSSIETSVARRADLVDDAAASACRPVAEGGSGPESDRGFGFQVGFCDEPVIESWPVPKRQSYDEFMDLFWSLPIGVLVFLLEIDMLLDGIPRVWVSSDSVRALSLLTFHLVDVERVKRPLANVVRSEYDVLCAGDRESHQTLYIVLSMCRTKRNRIVLGYKVVTTSTSPPE